MILQGDALSLPLPDESIDAVVTDPPYGIGFMGKEWDSFSPTAVAARKQSILRKGTPRVSEAWPSKLGDESQGGGVPIVYDESPAGHERFQRWCEAWALEALRVLKPGGHMLVFSGTRTYHRLVCGVEDAGFEVRDCIMWLFGSGFPKSLDVSKAIDAAAGARREVVGSRRAGIGRHGRDDFDVFHGSADEADKQVDVTTPATPDAERWQGWGTALKPGYEPILVARKPLSGTVAANVLEHGTGAINIDASRIATGDDLNGGAYTEGRTPRAMAPGGAPRNAQPGAFEQPSGRWPANVVLDEEAAELLDQQTGTLVSGANPTRRGSDKFRDVYGDFKGQEEAVAHRGTDAGGASRFYYVAKTSRAEREHGLHDLDEKPLLWSSGEQSPGTFQAEGTNRAARNNHPTVKPVALMRYLVKLVAHKDSLVLDPFAGSGSTLVACRQLGIAAIGIEKEGDYCDIAKRRADNALVPVRDTTPKPKPEGQGSLL